MNKATAWAAALLVAAGCGNNDQRFNDLVPIISVNPTEIAFGKVGHTAGSDAQETLFISNAGASDLEVTALVLVGDDLGAFALDATALTIPRGEEAHVGVTFNPSAVLDYDARVMIESNDKETPRVVVPMSGEGIDEPLPEIVITPGRTIAFDGVVPYADVAQQTFKIENHGDAPLEVYDIVLEDMGAAVFEVQSAPEHSTIAPNGVASVLVQYAPDDEVGDLSVLHIHSNDEEEGPDTTVQLVGNGGGPYYEPPVAIIGCPDQVWLTGDERIWLDGSASHDPGDPDGLHPLTYFWTYQFRPPASDSDPIDPYDQPRAEVHVDVAGTWIVALYVTNIFGAQSAPAICQFEAIPEDNIHVELQWDTPSADMDLHLVQGGWSLFDVPEDCFYCNTNPDWGVEGNDDDDPRLDLDDQAGYGPENINIFAPVDGSYDVRVHYWQENGDGPVQATVHVWVDGVEVFSDSQIMTRNQVWEVGTISWLGAERDFIEGSVAPYPAEDRGC